MRRRTHLSLTRATKNIVITIEQLRELAPWHSDVDVGNGIRTSDGNDKLNAPVTTADPMKIGNLLKRIYPSGLADKSFLDVACNCGAYSLLARDMGASRVLGFDVREHWIRQANFLHDNPPRAA